MALTSRWELRAIEPGPVRIPGEQAWPLAAPTIETVGVVWEGRPMAMEDFLRAAGEAGWRIAGVGNISDRHHRLYLQRPLEG